MVGGKRNWGPNNVEGCPRFNLTATEKPSDFDTKKTLLKFNKKMRKIRITQVI